MINFERKYNRMFLKKIIQSISKFNMIKSGDRVAVGLSGGKDSVFLLFCLKLIQQTHIKDFSLMGVNIDMGLGMNMSPLINFCNENEIPIIIEKTNIAEVIFQERKEKSPCSLCSKLRRGALVRVAKANNINKIALGHNTDDVIETLFMNVIKVGKLGAFHPNIYHEDNKMSIIRPMIYLREPLIEKLVKDLNLPIIKSLCPEDKKTTREEMKNLLFSLENIYEDAADKIIKSLDNVNYESLWNKK